MTTPLLVGRTKAEYVTTQNNTSTVENDLNELYDIKVDKIEGKGLSANDLTDERVTHYDAAYTHSLQPHSPANAERNIIVGVKRNGVDLEVSSDRKVDVYIPTKVSEFENDKNYQVTDTHYTLTKDGMTFYLKGTDGSVMTVPDKDTTYTTGTVTYSGLTKLYTSDGENTDGTLTQKAIHGIVVDINQAASDLRDYADKEYLHLSGGTMTGALTTTDFTANSATINGIYIGLDNSKKVIKDVSNIIASGVVTSPSFVGELTGNSSTATTLKTARTISISNHATGSVSFDGSKNVDISITLADSGVTAGTYGPSADVTGNHDTTIKVPEISVDKYGRVTKVVDKTYTSVNTHWTTGLYTASSSSVSSSEAVTTNGVFLNLYEASVLRNSHKIVGSGTTTVTSDSNGAITINSTVYKNGTGLSLDGSTFNHTDSITADTIGSKSNDTPDYSSTFTVPWVTYNSTGHITSVGTKSVTIPGTASLVVSSTNTGTSNAASSSGVYLNIVANSKLRSSNKLIGSGNITVSSDSSGNITVTGLTATGNSSSSGLTKLYTSTGTNTDGAMTQKAVSDALDLKLNVSLKGKANGLAELDANGTVPASQLPSYVDDVLEYTAKANFPTTGETGKIYVDTTTNLTYRWSGSDYREISQSLALGETSSTAYRGDRGKVAYDHAISAHSYLPLAGGTVTGTITAIDINPSSTNTYSLGTSTMYWKNVHAATFYGALSGNASTATKLATARTIQTNLSSTSSASFDGSANITPGVTGTLAVSNGGTGATDAATARSNLGVGASGTHADSYFALAGHTHSYLPLSGGTITGQIDRAGYSTSWIRGRDNAMIRQSSISGYSPFLSVKTTNGSWEIGSYDNSSFYDMVVFSYCTDANYTAGTNSTSAQIKFSSGGVIYANTFSGTLSGNASTATKLATTRTIQTSLSSTSSASFDGSANITPGVTGTLAITNGGTGATDAATARSNLGVGASGTHADSYFALASHTHSYLPLSGGTMTGTITSVAINPSANNTYNLGTSSAMWANIYATTFYGALSGNANTATRLANVRCIFSNSFDGTGDVAGQAFVYGNYNDYSTMYYTGGIQVREKDLVTNSQTDFRYSPSIGFHWGNITGGSINLFTDGGFYFRTIDGTTRATIDANVVGNVTGNATTATKLYTGGSTSGYSMTFNWSGQSGQPTWLWGGNSTDNMYVYNPSNFSVYQAGRVTGSYTYNGGQQPPNYFGKNTVGFLMMNTTVNNNSQYKDWIIMDCYSGSDVGGGVAFGVNRQSLGAYIMRSAAERTSWAESAELLGTHNYKTYCTPANIGAAAVWTGTLAQYNALSSKDNNTLYLIHE